MSIALPIVTRREIAREFRPDGTITDESALRRLRDKHALSTGVSAGARASGGKLGGRTHLYSALNRDSARALRQKNGSLATRISKEAARLEGSVEMHRLAAAVAEAGGAASAAELARRLSEPALAHDVIALERGLRAARRRLGIADEPALLSGYVATITTSNAVISFAGVPNPVTIPRQLLTDAGLDDVGDAVSAVWEILTGGRTLLTVEAAVDLPEFNADGEPLVDMYGTPWGRLLADPDATIATGVPTITIPAGIPDIE